MHYQQSKLITSDSSFRVYAAAGAEYRDWAVNSGSSATN